MVNRTDSSNANRQALSSLMDGELSDQDAADACAGWRGDAQARCDWHAYHLIGDVLRSEDLASNPAHDAGFLQALRLRLADEPVPLAPAERSAGLAPPAGVSAGLPVVAPVQAGRARRSRSRHWLMAPAAVAAGFMTVAAVLVVTQSGPPGQAPAGTLALASSSAPAASATLVRDARLDRYIFAHRSSLANGAAASGGAEHRVHIVFEGQ